MNEIATVENHGYGCLQPASIAESKKRFELVHQFVRELMHDGSDYGIIPGAGDKPALLKPGAEKLCTLFSLRIEDPEIVEKVQDWTGDLHGGEPFFYYLFRQRLTRNGEVIASQLGSCNSRESKYRYRKLDRVCPACGKPAIKRSKYPPRNQPKSEPGWYCYGKIGGCGTNFSADDPAITSQATGKVVNPDVADQVNTILKMAQKRALVASVLLATNASELFTQDVEDLAEHEDALPPEPVQAPPVRKEPPPPARAFANTLLVDDKALERIRELLADLGKQEAPAARWASKMREQPVEALASLTVEEGVFLARALEREYVKAGAPKLPEPETADVPI